MLHEIENKIERAFVFPEMATPDLMINLGEESETIVCFFTHLPEVNGFLLVCDDLSQLKSSKLEMIIK